MGFTVHAPSREALANFIEDCFDVTEMRPGRARLYGAGGAYLSWGTPAMVRSDNPTVNIPNNGEAQVNI